ncbi:MAG: guanine deaminase [Gammaproteobacteria bacterium]|nr:MAG: guanine deaminase [Gammaproteobacteria bacterium]
MSDKKAFRAEILHCLGDPGEHADATQVEYFADGLLIVEDGHVAGLGDAEALLPGLADDIELIDQRGNLICPGFIDCHVHFSQVDIIASYGEQLLDWLNRYAYPAEQRFSDAQHADEVANFFTDELLRNGTTTALVFPTVHEESVDAIFSAASKRNMRLLSGKILMDQHCPEAVRDDAESAYSVSRRLLEKWHGKGRLGYALTPRFAVTSSEAQLAAVGKLAAEFPDVHIHTHLAENHEEVDLIAKQFPWSRSYLDVYDHFGLVRERSVFAHCLHLDDKDRERMANSGSAIAFCPTSNLFLGSGLFNLRSARESGIRVGLATDVGGGTSLNMLRTMSEAYKVLHLESQSLPGIRALYLATLGAAEALYMDDKIGNFATGKEADFVVLNYAGAQITTRRLAKAEDIAEKLFALIMLGDDRNISATHVMGQKV